MAPPDDLTETISGWAGWEDVLPLAVAMPAESTSSPLVGVNI
jgi:hypothetical protein